VPGGVDGGGPRRAPASAADGRTGRRARRAAPPNPSSRPPADSRRTPIPADAGGPPTRAVPALRDVPPSERGDTRPAARRAARDRHDVAGTPRPLRYRVLPRTVLGLSSMILAFAIGAGFSGAILYSYYQYRLDQNTSRVNALVDGDKRQFLRAEGDLSATAARAKAQIQQSLLPIQRLEANPGAQAALIRTLGRSLFFVSTEDVNGRPSVGTAFVVASNSSETLLLTSYTTIEAATTSPGPAVLVRQGTSGDETQVTVRTWDAAHDLALIVLPRGGLPPVHVAPPSAAQLAEPVYALSGIGTAGASIAQGEIDDVSTSGIADDVPLGQAFQGGPVVNASGQVIAVASRTYAPFGFSSDTVWYAPFVDLACQKVLSCPGGSISASN
jgi:S1-C subfamily serine protease